MTSLHQHPIVRLASAIPLLLLSMGGVTFAQESESRAKGANERSDQHEEKADSPTAFLPSWIKRRLPKGEQAEGNQRGFAPAFGDIKRGSGFAPGVAYRQPLAGGGVVVLKGAYSIRNYKLVQLGGQSQPLAAGRIIFRGRARWQDAPSVHLYSLGSDSLDFRTGYAETKTEVSGEAAWTPVRFLRFVGGVGLEQFDTGLDHNAEPAGRALFASMPGAGADPRYVHSQGSTVKDQPRSICARARVLAGAAVS